MKASEQAVKIITNSMEKHIYKDMKKIARRVKFKQKLRDIGGYILFLLFLIVMAIPLFVTGGLLAIPRFYLYVSAKVHNKEPKRYII